ncbi:helix-hairpin-helix domain-containing protein [Halobaculum sp. CBA1158]|uniref:helix-hairpin-helix domain-containing protein n=1 Tax=Halobaculum sp. CBA1158 TaxID=2904243 RepID=UPI001F2934E2|nr:helix-hairpin-helix domain-containing protein [Halobaculum sp. CBA1158]UIO98887.1 helix-hairpin-helix domain-containing protein [Halobaculum sp. CBA1158]
MTEDLTEIPGVGPARADALTDAGFDTPADVRDASPEALADRVDGFGEKTAEKVYENAAAGDNVAEMGRPSKLNVQRQEAIASMIEDGQSIRAACRCNGISHETFYDWLRKGDEQEEGVYADFADRIARARGAGESRLVDDIIETAREKGDTRTLLSVLKSRYPESWGDADAGDSESTVEVYLTADRD